MNLNKLFSKTAFLLLLSVSLIGCDTDTNANTGVDATGQTEENLDAGIEEVETDSEIETSQAEENVTTEDVAEEAEDLIGQTVTIRSEAIAQIEPATFTVADREYYGGEDIIVVNATGTPFVLPAEDDTEVQITGEVTEFVLADIESVYDLDLDPDLYVEYSDRPAIIA